jgi:REP element-mobilizing transposase RayT
MDDYTGKSFEHRRDWVEARLLALAEVFAVSIWAYAVMSNHVHVVVEVRADAARAWSDDEVARRWLTLYPPSELDPEAASDSLAANPERIAVLRTRLSSLSWLMKSLNEHLARRANAEDGCSGRFWEGRFRCQALLDEAAVLAAMTYVDLNPIRAGITDRLIESHHTSIVRRIAAEVDARTRVTRVTGPAAQPEGREVDEDDKVRRSITTHEPQSARLSCRLAPIAGLRGRTLSPLTADYIDLVEFTCRHWHSGKPGRIDPSIPSLLRAHPHSPEVWIERVQSLRSPGTFARAIGSVEALSELATRLGQRWIKGIGIARALAT